MTKIVFLDRGTFAPEIELVRPNIEHDWVEYAANFGGPDCRKA